MDWDKLLMILGSLGFFIFGMKTMSDGIQKAAGTQLRKILSNMARNRYLGVVTGFLITALVQSSSATTVMTVSFVNAGLLSLVESAGIMMGANIGTTITGWLVSIFGFEISLSHYSIPLFALGLPLFLSEKGKLKYWGEFILGFAMLFLALSYLKESVPDLHNNSLFLSKLQQFSDHGILSRLAFVLIGTLITIIVQSSSAAMAITLTMVSQGWLPFDIAAAMVLGENIGTTITAELASLVGNLNAKRAARIHSLFNIIGVSWMVIALPFFLQILQYILVHFLGMDAPFQDATTMPMALSAFHTAFNLTNVLVLIGFVPFLVSLSKLTVPGGKNPDRQSKLKYIGGSIRTPELALEELQKETAHYAQILREMLSITSRLMISRETKAQKKLIKKVSKYEKITDEVEEEINHYITKLNKQEKTEETSRKLNDYLNIASDLERIGDIFYQISKSIEQKIEKRQYFVPEQKEGIIKLLELLDKAFSLMIQHLNNSKTEQIDLTPSKKIEKEINQLRNQLRLQNFQKLGEELYDVKTAILYMNIISRLEKVGDNIMMVGESITGESH